MKAAELLWITETTCQGLSARAFTRGADMFRNAGSRSSVSTGRSGHARTALTRRGGRPTPPPVRSARPQRRAIEMRTLPEKETDARFLQLPGSLEVRPGVRHRDEADRVRETCHLARREELHAAASGKDGKIGIQDEDGGLVFHRPFRLDCASLRRAEAPVEARSAPRQPGRRVEALRVEPTPRGRRETSS